MIFKRVISLALASTVAFAAMTPVNAFVVQHKWHVSFGDNVYPNQTDDDNLHLDAGYDHPHQPCGTFSSGNLIFLIPTVWGNATAMSGAMTSPTGAGTGWNAAVAQKTSTNPDADQSAIVYWKVSDGTETCAHNNFRVTWPVGSVTQSYVLLVMEYTGGTPPATKIDNADGNGDFAGDGTLTANAVTPSAHSDDLLLGIWTTLGSGTFYSPPASDGWTTIADTSTEGGVYYGSEILVAAKTLSSSASTGAKLATSDVGYWQSANFLIPLAQPSAGGGGGVTCHPMGLLGVGC